MVVRGRDDEKNHVQRKGKEKAHEKENLRPGIRTSWGWRWGWGVQVAALRHSPCFKCRLVLPSRGGKARSTSARAGNCLLFLLVLLMASSAGRIKQTQGRESSRGFNTSWPARS